MYVKGSWRCDRSYKVYVFLISIEIAKFVRMNTYISGTIGARAVKFDGSVPVYCTLIIHSLKLDHADFRLYKLWKVALEAKFEC